MLGKKTIKVREKKMEENMRKKTSRNTNKLHDSYSFQIEKRKWIKIERKNKRVFKQDKVACRKETQKCSNF